MGGMFFDTAGPGGGRKGRSPQVLEHEVTLQDLYNGKKVKMNMERQAVCGQCHGCPPSINYFQIEDRLCCFL